MEWLSHHFIRQQPGTSIITIWYTHNILQPCFFDSAILNVPLFILNKPSIFWEKHQKHISHHDAKDITAQKAWHVAFWGPYAYQARPRNSEARSTNSDEPRAATEEVHGRVMNEVPNENANPTIAWFHGDP